MAGRFSQQFSNQLGSLMSFQMPRGQRELTPQEIAEIESRTLKEQAQTGKFTTEQQNIQQEIDRARRLEESKKQGQAGYIEGVRKGYNIPLVLSPIEMDRKQFEIDLANFNKFKEWYPDSPMQFEEFRANKAKPALEKQKIEADIAKVQAETKKAENEGSAFPELSANQINRLAVANESGSYGEIYNSLTPTQAKGLPSPDRSKDEIAAILAAGGAKTTASRTFGSDVQKAIDEGTITGTKATQSKIEQAGLTTETASTDGGKKYPKVLPQAFESQFNKLSSRFESRIQPYEEQKNQARRLKVLTDKFNTGDTDKEGKPIYNDVTGETALAIITGFNKVLDPRSVAREAENAQVKEAANGLAARVEQLASKFKTGQFLPAEAVRQMAEVLSDYENFAINNENDLIKKYGKMADDRDQDPFFIIGDYSDRYFSKNQQPITPKSNKSNKNPLSETAKSGDASQAQRK